MFLGVVVDVFVNEVVVFDVDVSRVGVLVMMVVIGVCEDL